MSQTYEFYAERVREAMAAADAATLDNVRDRALRSAATWSTLADQARAVTEQRVKTERKKAALRAEEARLAAEL